MREGGPSRAWGLRLPYPRRAFFRLKEPARGLLDHPFRAQEAWDQGTGELHFVNLPAQATIRIYTLAGDLVETIEHDGSGGNGQASWNLISRNGQETESGVYLFTVDSPLGHQVGKFVVMR
jgi:hypothetical protein